ncbi:MAG: ATP-binding protein [Minisyncoccales bacterium]
MPTLHLICGLPGSGKSTLAKKLEVELPALRLTPDEWMARILEDGFNDKKRAVVESIQWEIAQKGLQLGIDVILENGFWIRKERDAFRDKAKEIGARVKLHYLNVPKEKLWRRLKKRNNNLPSCTFPVKESDLNEWIKNFEAPTVDELRQDKV